MPGILAGKVALVTGGGTGIGRATAMRFIEEGANVIIAGIDVDSLRQTCGEADQSCEWRECDVTDEPAFTRTMDELPQLDILVNNAGIGLPWSALNDDLSNWRRVLDVNLMGQLYGCRAAAKKMAAQGGGGRIVNITSVHATMVEVGSANYATAKAAVTQMTRALAVEWAPHGILLNTVAPGFVDTWMSRAGGENELETDWFKSIYVERRRIALARAAQPEEIAEAILFCANPRNTYMTGATIVVDGGLSLTL